ncbi:MAG: GntR family transcriptional regulator [Armatimonadota bacterium]
MLISIDEQDPRPIYLQVTMQVKEQIRSGDLKPGDELPSVRELAESLGVNLHTVHRAYQRLRDQGVIILRLGQRAKVAKLRQLPASQEEVNTVLAAKLKDLITEAFHLGLTKEDFKELVDDLIEAQGGNRE